MSTQLLSGSVSHTEQLELKIVTEFLLYWQHVMIQDPPSNILVEYIAEGETRIGCWNGMILLGEAQANQATNM